MMIRLTQVDGRMGAVEPSKVVAVCETANDDDGVGCVIVLEGELRFQVQESYRFVVDELEKHRV